jgi:hypothetical protein
MDLTTIPVADAYIGGGLIGLLVLILLIVLIGKALGVF